MYSPEYRPKHEFVADFYAVRDAVVRFISSLRSHPAPWSHTYDVVELPHPVENVSVAAVPPAGDTPQ